MCEIESFLVKFLFTFSADDNSITTIDSLIYRWHDGMTKEIKVRGRL